MAQCNRCKDIYGASEMVGNICKNCINSAEEERELKEDIKQKELEKYNHNKKRLEKITLYLVIYNYIQPILLRIVGNFVESRLITILILITVFCTFILAPILSLRMGLKYNKWGYFIHMLIFYFLVLMNFYFIP